MRFRLILKEDSPEYWKEDKVGNPTEDKETGENPEQDKKKQPTDKEQEKENEPNIVALKATTNAKFIKS